MRMKSSQLLRHLVRLVVLTEKKKKKPGGGLTDVGALMHLDKNAAFSQIRTAMVGEKGNIDDAAERLDVSTRRLYDYLAEPELSGIKTAADLEDEAEERREKEAARLRAKKKNSKES